MALCLNCGETKFGAWCPCRQCGVESCGNLEVDILFSDHRMSVPTLERFGAIIKQIASHSDEADVRFWALISYVSAHPSKLLSATPPSEIADRVEALLAELRLPTIELDLKSPPRETGPPQKAIAFPESLFRKYCGENRFFAIQRVQVRRRDGFVVDGFLMDSNGSRDFVFRADIEMLPQEIVAVRTAPGCLFGWLLRPKWVEAENVAL